MTGQTPPDWVKELKFKDARGIVDKHDTNHGLARRDYKVKCDTGTEPLMIVEGFWIWFCKTHHQPQSWCERAAYEGKVHTLRVRISDARSLLNEKDIL